MTYSYFLLPIPMAATSVVGACRLGYQADTACAAVTCRAQATHSVFFYLIKFQFVLKRDKITTFLINLQISLCFINFLGDFHFSALARIASREAEGAKVWFKGMLHNQEPYPCIRQIRHYQQYRGNSPNGRNYTFLKSNKKILFLPLALKKLSLSL